LKSVNKELEAFSYSVSHDLRSPLRSIDGYAEMLGEEYSSILDEEGNRLLDIIKDSARNMGELIDDLLTFSRMGRKELQRSKIDMTELFKTVFDELSESVDHKAKIKINKLSSITADASLIKQVLINLISNAIKYSSKKEKPVIEIKSEVSGKYTIYSVRDNGVGFDMQFSDKLFGVFQRLHSENEFEGTGVGLALVQRIIIKHGGEVWAEAKENEGAVFYFKLPNLN